MEIIINSLSFPVREQLRIEFVGYAEFVCYTQKQTDTSDFPFITAGGRTNQSDAVAPK